MQGLGLGTNKYTLRAPSFLEEFTGAEFAVSLRDLAGNDPAVIRLRRKIDNAERDFKASELGVGKYVETWVADGASPGADKSAFVKSWYDQSGNSRDFSILLAGLQPLIVDPNGDYLSEIQFSGANRIDQVAGSYSVPGPYTFHKTFEAGGPGFFFGVYIDYNSTHFAYINSNTYIMDNNTSGGIGYSATQGQTNQLSLIFDGGSSAIRRDGTTAATGTASPASGYSTAPLQIGNVFGTGCDFSTREWILYAGNDLSRTLKIEDNQISYWGTPFS